MVRAKFRVDRIERTVGNKQEGDKWVPAEVRTVVFSPVYSDEKGSENKKFWEATPSGEIRFTCINLEAANQFELGNEYYVDFSRAE